MINWKKSTVLTLITCLSIMPLSDVSLWAKTVAAASLTETRESLNLLGEGAKVKVVLTDGTKLKGVVQGVDESGLVLMANGKQATTVAFDQIGQLKSARRSYKAKGSIDAQEARRAVVGLGVGQHIMVKFDGDKELHGFIKTIGMDRFSILPDHQSAPVEVAYNDIQVVHQNMGAGATLAIVIGIIAAAAIIAVIVTGSDTVRGSL